MANQGSEIFPQLMIFGGIQMTGIASRCRTLGLGLLMALVITGVGHADTYQIDRIHSSVGFNVKHIFTQVTGKFNDFSVLFSVFSVPSFQPIVQEEKLNVF